MRFATIMSALFCISLLMLVACGDKVIVHEKKPIIPVVEPELTPANEIEEGVEDTQQIDQEIFGEEGIKDIDADLQDLEEGDW